MAPGLRTTTTTMLLDRLRDPQEDSVWAEFDARYRPILVGVGVKLGLSEDDAADAAQETLVQFLADYREGRYAREKGRLQAWLLGICRHRVMDIYRKRGRAGGREHSLPSALPTTQTLSTTWDAIQAKVIFSRAMELLRNSGRVTEQTIRVFELVALRGVPASTVAATMGIKVDEVYRIKHRITRRLRELVNELTQAYTTKF